MYLEASPMSEAGILYKLVDNLFKEPAPFRHEYRYLGHRVWIECADQVLFNHVVSMMVNLDYLPVAIPATPRIARICFVPSIKGLVDALPATPPRHVQNAGLGQFMVLEYEHAVLAGFEDVGMVVVMDDGRLAGLVHRPSFEGPSGENRNLGAMVQVMLVELLQNIGCFTIHAGGVSGHQGAHLWSGPSGSGKTTQILRLANAGWRFLGDDQVLLERDVAGNWCVWPYWRDVAVSRDTWQLHPFLQQRIPEPDRDKKSLVSVKRLCGDLSIASYPLAAVHFIDRDQQSRHDKLSPNDAIRFLGESFMHYLWSRRAGPVLDLMLDLASRVPMYSVSQGYCNRAAQPYWDNPL